MKEVNVDYACYTLSIIHTYMHATYVQGATVADVYLCGPKIYMCMNSIFVTNQVFILGLRWLKAYSTIATNRTNE